MKRRTAIEGSTVEAREAGAFADVVDIMIDADLDLSAADEEPMAKT